MSLRPLCVVLLLPALALAQAKLEFKNFSSKDQGFSILMPGTPKEQKAKVPSALGELVITGFVLETSGGKVAWVVTCNDYPAGTVKADNQAAILDGVVKGAAEGVKGKLLSKNDILLEQKHAGRSFQAEVPGLGNYHSRVYLVGDRLYQVIVLGPKDISTGADATKYLDSFKLVK